MKTGSATARPPRVSVVMPAYNAAGTLCFAVNSVRAQTLGDWELLIIDDGSDDASAEIARAYCAADRRIRLLSGQRRGVSSARNLGIGASRAPIVAFLDADDGWHPDKLASHLRHLQQRPSVGVSFSQAAILDERGRPAGQCSRGRTRGVKTAHLLYSNPTTTTSTLVVRRKLFNLVGLFNPGMSFAEDLEWLIRASLARGHCLEGLDQPLTWYRTSSQGLSAQLDQMQAGWEQLIHEVRTYAPKLVERHYHNARAEHLYYLARRALRLPDQAHRAAQFLRAAMAADPRLLMRKPLNVLAVFALSHIRNARREPQSPNPELRRI